ncbi:hypothetical protein BA6E_10677 [Bacteroidales bacterium 6E]|nr:hypothetical protein BA6E_10677 [Bacteroidales bacterium 6E]
MFYNMNMEIVVFKKPIPLSYLFDRINNFII